MKADTLKNSILQWAVEGKLVPQLDCEPAVEQTGEDPEDVPFVIPEKWKWVQLSFVGKVVGGGTPKTAIAEYWTNGTINWFTPADLGDIQGDYAKESSRKITALGLEKSSAVILPAGTVLFSSRAPIGHIAIATIECCTNQGCKSFVPDADKISTEWAYYAIHARTEEIKSRASGTTFKEISGKGMGKTWIPLPPLEEQRRIVQKLSELLPLVESYGREQEVLERLEKELPGKLRASLLNEAIQGKLVPQLDSEPQVKQLSETLEDVTFAIPEKWKWAKLSEVATKIQYGYTASASDSGSARLLRITDIQDGQVEWNSTPYCSPTASEIKKFELKTGDILIARTGGTIGKSFLVQNTPSEPSVFASYLIRISPETQLISPNFLKFFLESPYYWTQLKDNSRGTGQPNVNAKALGNLRLPLPPLEEQRRIVEKLYALFKDLDRLTG